MSVVMVRVPVTPGMTARDVFVEAVRVYMDCSPGQASHIVREREFNINRELTDAERRRSNVTVGLDLPDDWIVQQRQRTLDEIGALSPEQQAFIFQGGTSPAQLDDNDVDDFTRIVDLVAQLSDNERDAYLQQTSVDTTNPEDFARSLEAFAAHLRERGAAREARLDAETEIFGVWEATEAHLRRIRELQNQIDEAERHPGQDQYAAGGNAREELRRMVAEYHTLLRQSGFETEQEFGAAVRVYLDAYRDEAVLIANEALNRTAHEVHVSQGQIADDETLAEMFAALAPARASRATAARIRADRSETYAGAQVVRTSLSPENQREVDAHLAAARTAVRGLADTYPALTYGPDEWADAVAAASDEAALRQVLEGHFTEMRDSIATMRDTLDESPDTVWHLDELIDQVNAETGVVPGSGPARAVGREVQSHADAQLAQDLGIGAVAVAAGLVSMGEGTVAVLGAAAALGLGSYQAWEEFRRYDINNAANNTDMLTNDPSIAWAVVALFGVGLDMAGIAAILREVPAVTRAIRAVGQGAGDEVVEGLADAMRGAGRAELTGEAQGAVMAAARARAAENAAFDALRGQINNGDRLVLTAARQDSVTAEITHSVYASMQRGVDGIEQWVRSPEAMSLIGPFDDLAPEQMAVLREAYMSARNTANRIRTRAAALGLSEADTRNALAAWARSPRSSADEVLENLESFSSGARGLDEPSPRAPGPDDTIPDGRPIDDATEIDTIPDGSGFDETTAVRPMPDMPDPHGTRIVTDDILADVEAWRQAAHGVLTPDAPVGTVARLPFDNEPEVLRLFYAARRNSPNREVGLFFNRETGTWVLVQGDTGRVPWPSREQLVRMYGDDHPMVQGDAWQVQNWEVPIHTHPQVELTGITGTNGTVPSRADMSIMQRRATASGEITGGQIQYTTERGIQRAFFNFDPNVRLFTFGGPLPVEAGSTEWRFVIRYFDSIDQYAEEIFPLVGAAR